MSVSLDLYKVFHQVARSKSFSQAADRLFVTQSAVSQAIKNLESQLQVPLFFRGTRQVTLTPEGKLLMAHVEQAINFLRTAESKLQEVRELKAGEVHVGVSDTICKYYLLPVLADFNRRYPQVRIRVVNRTSPQILDLLRKGMVDLGIVTLTSGDSSVLVLPYLPVEDIFVASARFGQLRAHPVTLAELRNFPLLLLERGSSTRACLDGCLQNFNVELKAEIELESVDLLVQFAKAGLGIAHVAKVSVIEELKSGELFEVETKEVLPPRQLGIISLPQVPLSQAARKLLALLQQDAKRKIAFE